MRPYPREVDFFKFMLERERIRLSRLNGLPKEQWTDDPIFKEYSFTNVKRHHDRTTMLLIKEFYDERVLVHPSPLALLNASLFRYHGTIGTARAIGWSTEWTPERRAVIQVINEGRMLDREKVFTSAYIIPSCGRSEPKHEIVLEIIDDIWSRSQRIIGNSYWELASDELCKCYGVGQFMAKEILLDYILITGWKPLDWETWTPVGPGARRGAGVVVNDIIKGISPSQTLDVCRELYESSSEYWPDDFVSLDLTDIQFQLCEFAKYAKVERNSGRPKRKFKPTIDEVTCARLAGVEQSS